MTQKKFKTLPKIQSLQIVRNMYKILYENKSGYICDSMQWAKIYSQYEQTEKKLAKYLNKN